MFNAQDIKELREITGAGMLDCKKALESSNGNIDEAITWLREKGISKAAKKSDRIAAEGTTVVLTKDNEAIILEINCETDFVSNNDTFKQFVNEVSTALINSDAKTLEEAMEVEINGEKVTDIIISLTSKIGEKISFRRYERIIKKSDQSFGDYIHMGGKISVITTLEGNNSEIAKEVAMHICAMNPTYISLEDVPTEIVDKETEVFKEQTLNEGKSPEIAEKMVKGRVDKYFKEICLNEQPFIKEPSLSVRQYVKNNNSNIINMIRFEVGEGIQKKCENFAEEVQNQING